MARVAGVRWHAGAKAWMSSVGETGSDGRRKPVYFYNIPPGPKGSTNYRKAKAALDAYLAQRDAAVSKADELTFGDLTDHYLEWLKARVERDKANTLRGHRQALGRFLATPGLGKVKMNNRPAHAITGTEMGTILERWATVEELAPNYIGRILASVQTVLNWGADPLP